MGRKCNRKFYRGLKGQGTGTDGRGPIHPIWDLQFTHTDDRVEESVPFLWPQGQVHPLLLDHILKNVFLNLPVRDLERCMGVSTQWKAHASLTILGRRQSLVLRSNPSNYTQVKKYLEEMEQDQDQGIGSLDLVGLSIKNGELGWNLMEKFGATLEKLQLSCCSIPSISFPYILTRVTPFIKVLHLRSLGFTNKTVYGGLYSGVKGYNYIFSHIWMPQLEELKIVDIHKEDYLSVTEVEQPGHGNLAISLTLLMTAFPNLKSLYLRCNVRPPLNNEIPMEVREKCNWISQLTSMTIEPVKTGQKNLDMGLFRSLAYMTLSLRNLNLNPWQYRSPGLEDSIQTLNSMTMMLRMNAGSLKTLSILIKPVINSTETPVLPMFMPELETLTLTTNLIESFDHLIYFPKLKHFEIQEIEVGSILTTLLTQECLKVHRNVESLKVTHWGNGHLGNFAKIFPNLRALDLTLQYHVYLYYDINHTFSIKDIAKLFPNLESLRLRFPEKLQKFTDHEILGMSSEEFQNPVNVCSKKRSQLGLADMSRLKVVDLYPIGNIHDVSLKYGYSQLKDLEYMNLSKSQISLTELQLAVQRLPNLKVIKLEACSLIGEKDVEVLTGMRRGLKIIFSKEDTELLYCPRYRINRKMDHDEFICNCNDKKDATRLD